MQSIEHPIRPAAQHHDATPNDRAATLFVALELSLTRWIVVASTPGEDKASKHAVGRGSNQGNTQNEKSLYHQSSIDFRCYLEMALSEPRHESHGA